MITLTTSQTHVPEWDEYAAICPCTGRTVYGATAAQCLERVQESGATWARHNRATDAKPKYQNETFFMVDERGRVQGAATVFDDIAPFTAEEDDFLALLGLRGLPPEQRNLTDVRRWIAEHRPC